MSETRQEKHHLKGIAYSAVALGLALSLGACAATVPEPVGDGETAPSTQTTQPDANADTLVQEETNTNQSTALGKGAEAAKQALDLELGNFARGDVDEIDTSSIDQLDDMDLLTPAVAAAWLDGFSYEMGDATETSATTATVDVSITCRKIGAAYNSGGALTANQFADAITQLKPETTQVSVEMMLDDDNEWEPSMNGLEALNSALVGPMAR